MKKAVYGGSFDPVTNGHLWIIRQSAALFDEVVVAIGENVDKKYTFSLTERLEMLREVTQDLPNVTIDKFNHEFLVNYAKRVDAGFIVRGVRNSADYEYERGMRYVNSDLCQEINTIFLMPPRNYVEVSSSLVKGLVGPDGWEDLVKNYLPEAVFKRVHERYLKRSNTINHKN
jgi:pantetheine-phosphate adenylyltransferase/8-oxo-dGTP diphosphatase